MILGSLSPTSTLLTTTLNENKQNNRGPVSLKIWYTIWEHTETPLFQALAYRRKYTQKRQKGKLRHPTRYPLHGPSGAGLNKEWRRSARLELLNSTQ